MSVVIKDLYNPGKFYLSELYRTPKKYIVLQSQNHFNRWYSEYITSGLSISNDVDYKEITKWFLHNIIFPAIYLATSEKEQRVLLRICTGKIFSVKHWSIENKQNFFYNILEFYKQTLIVVNSTYSSYLQKYEGFPF